MILFFQRYFQPLMWTLLALSGVSLGALAATATGLWMGTTSSVRSGTEKVTIDRPVRPALRDYEIILQHNVFDAASRGSGSLTNTAASRTSQQKAQEPAPTPAPKTMVLLGTVSGGPEPLALLRLDRDIEIFHLGDELPGGANVESIERHRLLLRQQDGALLELLLQEGASPRPAPVPRTKASSPSGKSASVSYQVEDLGGNRWRIPEAEAERARGNLGELLKSAHMVPNLVNGQTDGFLVRMLKPGSLLTQMGLRVGDVVMEINGVALESPEKALQVFTQLRDARNISLGLVRGGQRLNFDYAVE